MSDQDNLRDRISTVMWSATISDGRRAAMVPDCKAMAQAIIDEFGLKVVEVDRIELIDHTAASYQIVGKWEKQ